MHEIIFEDIPMHYFEMIGHKTVRVLDLEIQWEEGVYEWLGKKQLQEMHQLTSAFRKY